MKKELELKIEQAKQNNITHWYIGWESIYDYVGELIFDTQDAKYYKVCLWNNGKFEMLVLLNDKKMRMINSRDFIGCPSGKDGKRKFIYYI